MTVARRVVMWHLHGSYATALLESGHTFLLPTLPSPTPFGRGRADTWSWPPSAVEVDPVTCASTDVDAVILQRPEEVHLAEVWLGGRRPGVDVPAIYLEHNAPQGHVNAMRHPLADAHQDRPRLTVVHVTHFNALFWDCGRTATRVIEHGVLDPGYRYTGELTRAVAAINEPARRARVTGTDLLEPLASRSGVPLDLFGIATEPLGGCDIAQSRLHDEMARRRVYLHPFRWTSLGLTLIEAMHLGMPVVALATTAVTDAVPPEAGVVSNDPDVLARALRRFVGDHEEAITRGKAAREAATARFGLDRFLRDWNALLEEVIA